MNAADKKEIKRLQQEKLQAQAQGNLKEESDLCSFLGEVYFKNGEYEFSIQEHQQELHLCESLHDIIGCAVAHRKIGERFNELQEYKQGLSHHKKHLKLAEEAQSYIEQQRAHATLGRTYLCMAESLQNEKGQKKTEAEGVALKSQESFLKSLAICDEHLKGDVSDRVLMEMRARIFLNLGILFENQNEFTSAVKFIKQAVFISQKHNLNSNLFRSLFSLADVYLEAKDFSKASRSLKNALQVAVKMTDKERESNTLTSLANVYFQLGDFFAAKRDLKKAYKLASRRNEDAPLVIRNLKAAIQGCKLQDELEQIKNTEKLKEQMSLYDKLGDLCCQVRGFTSAIRYYKRQLEIAKSLKLPAKDLIPIYVSLAQTYSDNKEFEMSIEMYQKELELRDGNPVEEFKTWLFVADAQENSGLGYDVIKESYDQAARNAEKSKKPKLQLHLLRELSLCQRRFGEAEHLLVSERKMQMLKEKYDLCSDDELSENEGSEQQTDSINDLSLELSESEGSEGEEEYSRPSATNRVMRTKFARRNEKGETQLHRACIDGNLNRVKMLVQQGHPVNPRDYCGWTPLHEACNFGHYEIVEYLLDNKVNINDPGGVQCGGLTPLLDAISCGNFEVVELLLRKGADVTLKDEEGNTALMVLRKWWKTYEKDLDVDTKRFSHKIAEMIRQLSKRTSPTTTQRRISPDFDADSDLFDSEIDSQDSSLLRPSSSLANSRHGDSSHLRNNSHARKKDSDHGNDSFYEDLNVFDSDGEDDVHNDSLPSSSWLHRRSDSDDQGPSGSGNNERRKKHRNKNLGRLDTKRKTSKSSSTEEYRKAMLGLGSAATRKGAESLTQRSRAPQAKAPSLIPEEDYGVVDDWLEDDMMDGPAKRRRVEHDLILGANGGGRQTQSRVPSDPRYSSATSSDTQSHVTRPQTKTNKLRRRQSKLPVVTMERSNPVEPFFPHSTENEFPIVLDNDAPSGLPPTGSHFDTRVSHFEHDQSTPPTGTPTSYISPSQTAPSIMRVRMRIQDKTFLIPVPLRSPKSMQWLADEAASRYYTATGQKPKLSVCTLEKALFSSEDIVSETLTHNEEVLGLVDTWDAIPIYDHYKNQCEKENQKEHVKIRGCLQKATSQHDIDLTSLALSQLHLKPFISTLHFQYNLQKLLLGGNCINDDLLTDLANCIGSLSNLCYLDLSCNDITGQGLRCISDTLSREVAEWRDGVGGSDRQKPLQHLEVLILDYNSLSDACAIYIAGIVKHCPLLSRLSLTSTKLTARFFQLHRMALVEAFKGACCLQTLNVSHNAFGSIGIELLLKCLNCTRLRSLDLTSVIPDPGDHNLSKHLAVYFAQTNVALQELLLRDCHMRDSDIYSLSKCVPHMNQWDRFDISLNQGVTSSGIITLFEEWKKLYICVKSLDISGLSALKSPVDDKMINAFSDLMSGDDLTELTMTGNQLSKIDLQVLMNVWNLVYRENALYLTHNSLCIFTCQNH